ncbi:LytTR family DNA-binding domain-containing protein [Ihubacter sp. mB4P-1]|uniref:LytTR family DNA-binding domain-containing protein n=1 Tax=Ihubacter sp. mB4P-1 TaxID=3242370 RepID=UPI00137948FF
MRVIIEEISKDDEEELILRCHSISGELAKRVRQMETMQAGLTAYRNGEIHRLAFDDVYYFEVVDGKSFFYCEDCVYESRMKLYEFEQLCQDTGFFRASKSMVLNADKIDFISPSFSGRFETALLNGEKVVVSRQYVNVLKKKMGL